MRLICYLFGHRAGLMKGYRLGLAKPNGTSSVVYQLRCRRCGTFGLAS